MALIKCPECGHDVSDSAASCPNCAASIKRIVKEASKPQLQSMKEETEWMKENDEGFFKSSGRLSRIGSILFVIGFFTFGIPTYAAVAIIIVLAVKYKNRGYCRSGNTMIVCAIIYFVFAIVQAIMSGMIYA